MKKNNILIFVLIFYSTFLFASSIDSVDKKIYTNKLWVAAGIDIGRISTYKGSDVFIGTDLDFNYCNKSHLYHKLKLTGGGTFEILSKSSSINTINYMRGFFFPSSSVLIDFSFGLGYAWGNKVTSHSSGGGGWFSLGSSTFHSYSILGVPFELKFTTSNPRFLKLGISIEGNLNKELPNICLRLFLQFGKTSNIAKYNCIKIDNNSE